MFFFNSFLFYFFNLKILFLYIDNISFDFFLAIANFFFIIGISGIILNRRNFLISLLFIEVMYTGISFYFLLISIFLNSPITQIYAITILVAAACESIIGLSLILILFKTGSPKNLDDFNELQG
jgi:NADH-quinone oxidoreductase subunit K